MSHDMLSRRCNRGMKFGGRDSWFMSTVNSFLRLAPPLTRSCDSLDYHGFGDIVRFSRTKSCETVALSLIARERGSLNPILINGLPLQHERK